MRLYVDILKEASNRNKNMVRVRVADVHVGIPMLKTESVNGRKKLVTKLQSMALPYLRVANLDYLILHRCVFRKNYI